ncbi:2147_t:CDS:2 [Paraglomus brasilianum]|uniref:2147_t:CDS:1 n=1 Tax=Paraglomus brasilianum TaxID=144538 RepID=A0A9N9AFM4_9GLOM|nr:2147_t:CDS:2 [Paraglomus brasilianum]
MEDLPAFELLETLLYEPQSGFYLLSCHLERLVEAAKYFIEYTNSDHFQACLKSDFLDAVETELERAVEACGRDNPQRVRLTVAFDGTTRATSVVININNQPGLLYVSLDNVPTSTVNNPFVLHKTTHRNVYEDARRRVVSRFPSLPIFDVVIYNEQDQVTECSIANIAVEYNEDGKSVWKTPPVECGLLPGVMRRRLIEKGELTPAAISVEELKRAQKEGRRIKCFNSVRKEYDVILVQDS